MFSMTKIDKKDVYKKGVSAGIGQIAYVMLVVALMNTIDKFMRDNMNPSISMLAVLLLFVFSAAVSGLIVFGYPAYLALQKNYHQAVLTALVTLLTIFIGFLTVVIFNFIF